MRIALDGSSERAPGRSTAAADGLAGGGRFTVDHISQHARTNAEVIERFMPVNIRFEEAEQRSACIVTARSAN